MTTAGRTFWRQQNVVRLCRNWSQAGARVVLLTVPPPGAPRDVLRDRYLSVIGVSAEGLVAAPEANESIGASSALVLRRVNELLEEAGLPFPAGQHLRKTVLAKTVMAARRQSEPGIGLPVAPWVEEHAATMVAKLQQLGVDLVGEWSDLTPVCVPGVDLVGEWSDLTPVCVPGVDPEGIAAVEVAEAACTALAGLLAQQIRQRGDTP